jgi:hypothetical protein
MLVPPPPQDHHLRREMLDYCQAWIEETWTRLLLDYRDQL